LKQCHHMTAGKIIEAMDDLPPQDQVRVIQHAAELARTRQLSGDELGKLAHGMVDSDDSVEIERLKLAMTSGFYGK
jgi:hypothetical protein